MRLVFPLAKLCLNTQEEKEKKDIMIFYHSPSYIYISINLYILKVLVAEKNKPVNKPKHSYYIINDKTIQKPFYTNPATLIFT